MFPLLLLVALASAQETPAPAPASDPAKTTPPASSTPATPAPTATPAPAGTPAATPAPEGTPTAAPAPAAPAPAEPAPVLGTYVPTVVFPIRAANLSAAEVRAAEILFRRRYEVAAGQAPADEDRVRAAIQASDDKGLHAACLQLTCTRWITIDLVRLDKEVFVTAIERDATATVLQRVEVVANGLDGLPSTFDRVARALAARVPIEAVPAARVPVAEAPSNPASSSAAVVPKGDDAEVVSGFKFGVLGPLWPGFGLSITHTFTWRREKKDKFLDISTGFTLPLQLTDDRTFGMAFAEVGLSHIFPSPSGTAFYAGGGLGPRVGGYDDFGFGAGVYGHAGLLLGRKTHSRAYVQLKLGGDAFTGYVEPYVVSYAGLETGVGF